MENMSHDSEPDIFGEFRSEFGQERTTAAVKYAMREGWLSVDVHQCLADGSFGVFVGPSITEAGLTRLGEFRSAVKTALPRVLRRIEAATNEIVGAEQFENLWDDPGVPAAAAAKRAMNTVCSRGWVNFDGSASAQFAHIVGGSLTPEGHDWLEREADGPAMPATHIENRMYGDHNQFNVGDSNNLLGQGASMQGVDIGPVLLLVRELLEAGSFDDEEVDEVEAAVAVLEADEQAPVARRSAIRHVKKFLGRVTERSAAAAISARLPEALAKVPEAIEVLNGIDLSRPS